MEDDASTAVQVNRIDKLKAGQDFRLMQEFVKQRHSITINYDLQLLDQYFGQKQREEFILPLSQLLADP